MTEQDSMTQQDSMTDLDSLAEEAVGPIDYLAIELPSARMRGEGLAAIVDLVDRGIIRVLDLRAVTREADGTFTAVAITDLDNDGTLDLAVFEGVESGMLDDDDLRQAAELIEPGKVVALLLYENTWASKVADAVAEQNGEVLVYERIPRAAIEELVAEAAAVPTGA